MAFICALGGRQRFTVPSQTLFHSYPEYSILARHAGTGIPRCGPGIYFMPCVSCKWVNGFCLVEICCRNVWACHGACLAPGVGFKAALQKRGRHPGIRSLGRASVELVRFAVRMKKLPFSAAFAARIARLSAAAARCQFDEAPETVRLMLTRPDRSECHVH